MCGANVIESIEKVLDFSTKLILMSLKNEKPTKAQIDAIRKHCRNLANENVFSFDVKAKDDELLMQIQCFATRVNG